ncbi:MAG: hypothetical protein HYV20_13150, partial [Gemmatimonadetes bacterium]|nr:hypothetical protein [Gemmatimonadota bacterium]
QQLSAFLDMMMGYELLYREALDSGVTISPVEFAELKEELAEQLHQVKAALGVYPPAPGASAGSEELGHRAAERVDRYLNQLPNDWQRFARVPPLLADQLRERSRWAVYSRGIEQSLRRAAELRAAQDSGATTSR